MCTCCGRLAAPNKHSSTLRALATISMMHAYRRGGAATLKEEEKEEEEEEASKQGRAECGSGLRLRLIESLG